ncbi:MAG: hypothetical protein ACN6P1_05440 [Pseudomonas sp.]|uniref:hypothetical protein n=1 Tax=Pseudomonas sp. TaxID=306 RepID=UPI003D10C756
MSPAIQLLLIQIMQTVARLHGNPDYQVFCTSFGNCGLFKVEIYPRNADWRTPGNRPAKLAYASACWSQLEWPTGADELLKAPEERFISELAFMRAALMAYLPAEAVEAEVAA